MIIVLARKYSGLSKSKLSSVLTGSENYAILTSDRAGRSRNGNKRAFSELMRLTQRYNPYRVKGVWKEAGQRKPSLERSLIILGIGLQEAEKLGRKFSQDAIVFKNKGKRQPKLYFLQQGQMTRYDMRVRVTAGSVRRHKIDEEVSTLGLDDEGGFTATGGAFFSADVDWTSAQVIPAHSRNRGSGRAQRAASAHLD